MSQTKTQAQCLDLFCVCYFVRFPAISCMRLCWRVWSIHLSRRVRRRHWGPLCNRLPASQSEWLCRMPFARKSWMLWVSQWQLLCLWRQCIPARWQRSVNMWGLSWGSLLISSVCWWHVFLLCRLLSGSILLESGPIIPSSGWSRTSTCFSSA